MLSLPFEVQSIILHHLDPSSLKAAFQACKSWNQTIQQDSFPCSYTQTRAANDIKALTPKLFERLLPYFSPGQLFYIDKEKITRHTLQPIPETESNQLNLRIVKLLSSLDWFQQILHKNKERLIPRLCQFYDNKQLHLQLFKETFEYMHLFRLGSGLYFKTDAIDEKPNDALVTYKNIPSIKKSIWDTLSPYEDISAGEYLCIYDYAALKLVNANVLDDLFKMIFSRYKIRHLKFPHGNSNGYFGMSTAFYKGLFAALTLQGLKTRTDETFEPMDISPEGSSTCSSYHVVKPLLPPRPDKYKLLDNYLSKDGFNTLKLYVDNDETLDYLKQWMLTTQIAIKRLIIFIWRPTHNITMDGMRAFGKSLIQCKVKQVHFHGHLENRDLSNLCDEISKSVTL